MKSPQTTRAERLIEHAIETNKTVLDLSKLQLQSIPTTVSYLVNLKTLDLHSNQLTALPETLSSLTNLKILDLRSNRLTTIPRDIGNLTNLVSLNISNNNLAYIPKELSNLSSLNVLDLHGNQLTTIPKELGRLSKLVKLFISNNNLIAIPKELKNLINLVVLRLRGNQLTSVPKELGELRNLEILNLYENQLTTIPKELGGLTRLTELRLQVNQLTTVPKELGDLLDLEILSLSRNHLTIIPESLGKLNKLKKLFLYKNQLTTVPRELGRLTELTELRLQSNQLTTIPTELGTLVNLERLHLEKNPDLIFPPPEIRNQGTRAILAYLQGQHSNNECQWISKLLVVGEGGVGKTSLLRALRGDSFDIQESSTHGIEVKELNLPHPSESDVAMTLNTWDFGGQEIYHSTHQFFLTNRSLFLLAFNARLGFEQGKLIYWLKTIRAKAPDSPVILVATWADERDADLPLSDLKQQFPKIINLYEVSNKTGKGIKKLRQAIISAAADLPLMGEIWPATWLKFANTIRKSKGNHTTPQKLWHAMAQKGVSDDGQPVLARWLHELGDILFFLDNPELNDLVILKPQWVTEYISKVLSAEAVIKKFGIFTRQCMDELWQDVNPSLRDHFLDLMEQFDLSYKIPEDPENKSLVVERLDYEAPDLKPLWDTKKQEPNCKEISMKFQLSEILAGIPTWFIARQHRFTLNLHWRTGVLFGDSRTANPTHLGLLQVKRDTRTNADYVNLTVRGPMPHSFFNTLRDGFEITLDRYPGLQITRLIPCPDPLHEDCKHEFNYANLTKRLKRTPPKETIDCEQCLETISVTQLLFGIHYTTQDAVIAKIDQLQASNQKNFDELRELFQRNVLKEIRIVQKQLESPCPSIFVLRPDDRKPWQKDIGSQRINLQLYCEHPGCLHPVKEGGLYPIDNPKKWLKVMTPHIKRLFSALKYVTPVIGPWINLSAPIYSELIKNDLALTKALISKLPEIKFDDDAHGYLDPDDRGEGPHKISGSALRMLHEFLKQKDPEQVWGGLTRTTTPEGDVLWLCKEHIKEIYPTSS